MTVFFYFKRLVGMAAQPLAVCFLLVLAGLMVSVFRRREHRWRWTGILVAVALLVLLLSSLPPLVRREARLLERRHSPLLTPSSHPPPRAVVVLGSGVAHPGDAALPALSRLNDSARARLVEGVRLALRWPEARLITTGFGIELEGCADAMALAAGELGVQAGRIDRLQTMDTADEARQVKALLGDAPVVVVTSAAHMPRTMLLFEREGVNAVAAPCDYIAPVSEASLAAVDRWRWRPRGESISSSEEIWHEALGLINVRWFEKDARGGDSGNGEGR